MKIQITIDDEVDSEIKVERLIHADEMAIALWEIKQLFRQRLKYTDSKKSDQTITAIKVLAIISDEVEDILQNNKLDLDKLIE